MYKIVETASQAGKDSITEVINLLDDEISSKWIAYHLIEKSNIDPSIRKKCFKIIEKIDPDNSDDFPRPVEAMCLDSHS